MVSIDLGLDFKKAEEEATIKPVPAKDYDFQIKKVEVGVSGPNSDTPGRPKLNWHLALINNDDPTLNGRVIFYNTSLPWTDPSGEFVSSGLSFLTNIFLAVGEKWSGTSFDPDTLLGMVGKMSVGIKEYKGAQQNEVKKLYKKKV